MSSLSDIVSRIEKLLTLAGRSPFPGEAEAAQAMAQELITKYQIEQSRLYNRNTSSGIGSIKVDTPAPYNVDKSVLLNAIAKNNFCRVLRSEGYCYLYGTEDDIQLCLALYNKLVVHMVGEIPAKLAKAKQNSDTTFHKRTWITSFFGGYCLSIAERLNAIKNKIIADQTKVDSSVSLMVRDKEHAIEEFYQGIDRNPGYRRNLSSESGYKHGKEAGNEADLLQTKLED
jgi:hypothetical protein